MKKEKSCGIIVFDEDRVLLIKHNGGHISFPKGHVEEGDPEEARDDAPARHVVARADARLRRVDLPVEVPGLVRARRDRRAVDPVELVAPRRRRERAVVREDAERPRVEVHLVRAPGAVAQVHRELLALP